MRTISLFVFILIFSILVSKSFCQTTIQVVSDTSQFPYWIEMMQDPTANFFKTQRAFNQYWENRPVTKGCGWKVFKRWEYMMQTRVAPDGTKPAPDATYNSYTSYIRNIRSVSGNWIPNGPSLIPAPGPAGYEGLGRLNVIAFHPTDPNKWYVGAPSGGMWQTDDGGTSWVTHTDTLPTLGVSAILLDQGNPATIYIGTGDRDAGDAPGLGVFKSTNGGLTWIPWKTGMGDKTVGKLLQHPGNGQILLAATSGGIYRSTDSGTTWIQTQTGNFKDMAFKPADPAIVYAAAGADFYRSSDNGLTFVKIESGLTGGQRGTIAVTPANPNYVYFIQSNNSSGFKGLYRSTDAGLTFTTRSTAPNILDWSCDGSGTGGQGWYDLALTADPTNMEIIYAGGVDVWKSVDGGLTWSINSHWYGGCSVPAVHADCHFLTYSPVDGHLYACNDGGVYATGDGGATWTDYTETMTIGQIYKLGQSQTVKGKVINGFQDNGTYTFIDTGWVATGGGDGMECAVDYCNASYTYHTLYYGSIFRKFNNYAEKQIAGEGVYGITESGAWVTPFILHETNPEAMFVGYKNVWRSVNIRGGSITWLKISDNLGGNNSNNMAVLEQSPANTDILYAARYDNRLFRTDNCNDDNPIWIELTSNLPVGGSTVTDLEAHPSNSGIIYMTLANHVYKSEDKGLTWTDISGTLPNITYNSIVYYKNAIEGLYVASDAGVFYKDESLTDWIPFSSGLPANARITELEIYYNQDTVANDLIRASSYGRGLWESDMYHAAPDAEFMADKTIIPIGCDIGFTDLSNGVPTSWVWTFEGGTPGTSTDKNPSGIVYDIAGIYEVKMVCSNTSGSDSLIKTNYITVSDTLLPIADFTTEKLTLCSGETALFTDLTENCPNTWLWEFTPNTVIFLNGTNAYSQYPLVQFMQSGSYTVKLTASNNVGSASITKPNYLFHGGYSLPFEDNFEQGFDFQQWSIVNPDYSITWDTISVPGTTPGNKAAWMNFYDYIQIMKRDQLISPVLDFSDFQSVTLTFKHAYAQRYTLKDSLIVLISDDCGSSYSRLLAVGPDGTPNSFVTHEPTVDPFYPSGAEDWCSGTYGVACYTIDLTPWAWKPNIKLMFEAYNRSGNNLFIDDITVTGVVSINPGYSPSQAVMIYPNPSTGVFNLVFKQAKMTAMVEVLTIHGQVILHQSFANEQGAGTTRLDLSHCPKGVYIVKIISGNTIFMNKIVIN